MRSSLVQANRSNSSAKWKLFYKLQKVYKMNCTLQANKLCAGQTARSTPALCAADANICTRALIYVHIVIKIYLLRCPVQLGLRVQLFYLVLGALCAYHLCKYFAAAPKNGSSNFRIFSFHFSLVIVLYGWAFRLFSVGK
jgi:hypothetical protein